MSRTGEADSMWLQKSIALSDPLPCGDDAQTQQIRQLSPDGKENARPANDVIEGMKAPAIIEKKMAAPLEMDLTKMILDTSTLINAPQPRPSTARYSTRMASVAGSALITAQEYDDLRAKYSKARREVVRLSDIEKDLDFSRFELTRAQEDVSMLRKAHDKLRKDCDEAIQRAEKANKAKSEVEDRLEAEEAMHKKEIDFLKQQVDELRHESGKRLMEMSEQQENESENRIQTLREELAAAADAMDAKVDELEALQAHQEQLRREHETSLTTLETTQRAHEDLQKKNEDLKEQCVQLEKEHRDFVNSSKQDQEEAMRMHKALNEERVLQITQSKDTCINELKSELQEIKNKYRTMANEMAAMKHNNEQLTEELKQSLEDHNKELRHIGEEHRLALCEKQLQLEAAVRQARGITTATEEESQSLRRQLTKVSEELSTVAAVLVQREKQVVEVERELYTAKDNVARLEQENIQLLSDAEGNCAAAQEANERVRRLNDQKDTLEEEYSSDLRAAKERIRSLEMTLMETRDELSALRRDNIKLSENDRDVVKDLRAEVEKLTSEKNKLKQMLADREDNEVSLSDMRTRLITEQKESDRLRVELSAAINRCGSLETRLDDNLRHAIAKASSRSPKKTPTRQPAQLRSTSSVNVPPPPISSRSPGSSIKRARTEDARVFAISGFDGNDLFQAIIKLPNVAIAECKSNMPVPSNLTHLITNGQLTIKLLTALVRGCWILPEAYVVESLKQRTWLNEADFGFQHSTPPLYKKRIFVTEAFKTTKHFGNAVMLINEGGGTIEDDANNHHDSVLCTPSEVSQCADGMTWESLVELLYPVRVE